MSDSESHIFELIDGIGVHDVEIILSGGQFLRDFDSGDLIVYDLKLRIFEDEIIAELDRDNLIEAISLDHHEPIFVVLQGFRGDIRNIYEGVGVLESEADFRSENLSVFESEKYKVLSSRESILLYLHKKRPARICRMDALFSNIHELDALKVLPMKGQEIVDIGIVCCLIQHDSPRFPFGIFRSGVGGWCFFRIFLCRGRYFRLHKNIIRTGFLGFSGDLQQGRILRMDIAQIFFCDFPIVHQYMLDIKRILQRRDIHAYISR